MADPSVFRYKVNEIHVIWETIEARHHIVTIVNKYRTIDNTLP